MTVPSEATSQTLPTPALPARGTVRWRPWALLWVIVAVLQAVLLMNNAALDLFLWRTTRWFTGDQDAYHWAAVKAAHINDRDPPAPFYFRGDPPFSRTNAQGVLEARFYKRTEIFWRVMRDLGEPVMTGLIILIVWIYDARKSKAALIVLTATGVTGIAGWLIRAIGGRFRPINFPDGNNVWHLFRGFTETANLSWPSGHSTLAFATAAALSYLSPKGRNLFVTVAAFCAITRVVMQAHFYSDIIFGAALGWTLGWFTAQFLDRTMGGMVGSKSRPDSMGDATR